MCTRVCARPLARRSGVDRILPANAHELARDRLHVSITNARTRENRLVSCFASRDDLIQ
ncbi:patatin-like phospholipase domain-containing protein 4, partial [Cricetulus griseus]